jgi:hypothetical protein
MTEFFSHFEKALRTSATAGAGDRLQGSAGVIVADVANPAVTKPAPAPYELFGPGDVQRLAAEAITRRFPAPYAGNAEVTKLALVEFAAYDLPWRYTPQRPGVTNVLRPWLVLVVGQRAPGDIVLRPDGRVTLGLVAQQNHPLVDSSQWAHVHRVDGHDPVARVVAPTVTWPDPDHPALTHYGYFPDTEYVACLVPAFTAGGSDSWNGATPVTCDLYDWWTFRTGPEGDFRDLARKLHRAALTPTPGGKPFGRAEVRYRTRTTPPVTTPLPTAGALRLPAQPADPVDAAPATGIGDETAALTRRIVTPDGRAVITAPRYDAPFANAATADDDPVADAWADQLRRDPRLRGAAGLGAWNAIEWQDRISDAAAAKAGDLGIAGDRIRHVALGVEASRSLWRRRLPSDPAERLAVLLPALGRLLTTSGESALEGIAGRTPQLGRALLSSAARRAFRPGPARTALAADGRPGFGAVLIAANQCPDDRDPAEIRPTGASPESAIKRAIFDAAGRDDALAEAVLRHLGSSPSLGALAAALRALAPGPKGIPDREAVDRFLHTGDFHEPDRSLLEWGGWMKEHAAHEPCRPVDLDRLAGIVAGAIDPTVDRPPAVERVLSTLPGITHIGPVEIEPELDLPLWSFLSERSPDWMLPGAGDLLEGDVVALSTNPVFVESLLVGANHQATAELRWRNIPLVTRWSPLRKFWQRKGGEVDILPIKVWPAAAPLGSATLVPPGLAAEAVVAFRTSLFRRYPATVVYLYLDDNDWDPPDPNAGLDPNKRTYPTFTGTIGKDITFFGFKLAPAALLTRWLVLEEPPAGYRFYHQPAASILGPDGNSAQFAHRRFAVPVRVLIGKLLNEPE